MGTCDHFKRHFSSFKTRFSHFHFRVLGACCHQCSHRLKLSAVCSGTEMDDFPSLPIETVIGIVVAISGNVLISLALNLQKLAHKRLDAQKYFHANGSGHLRSLLTPRRGSSYAPSPNERDEDSDTITEPLTPPRWHTPILESQPLLSHRSGNNITLDREDDLPEHESCNPELFRRILSFKKLPNKIKQAAILPVDGNVVHGSESSQGWAGDEDQQTNETAYLKSKLW